MDLTIISRQIHSFGSRKTQHFGVFISLILRVFTLMAGGSLSKAILKKVNVDKYEELSLKLLQLEEQSAGLGFGIKTITSR